MQDRHLPEFLKSLKQDFNDQQEYFKILKVNSKFIQSCKCPKKYTHQYCGTAEILKSKSIYCQNCKEFYRLKLTREKLISPQTIKTISKTAIVYILLQSLILLLSKLDYHMKADYALDTNKSVEEVTRGNEFKNIIGLSISLAIVMMWCISLNLKNCINRNQKIIFAELLEIDSP